MSYIWRMTVGRQFWRLSSLTSLLKAGAIQGGCSGPCPVTFVNFSQDGVDTVFLGFVTFTVHFSLCPLPLVLSLAPLRRAWLCLLYFLQVFILIDSIPLSLLFFRLNIPSFLIVSSLYRCPDPFIILLATPIHLCISCASEVRPGDTSLFLSVLVVVCLMLPDSIKPLGNVFQCFTAPMIKKILLFICSEFPLFPL